MGLLLFATSLLNEIIPRSPCFLRDSSSVEPFLSMSNFPMIRFPLKFDSFLSKALSFGSILSLLRLIIQCKIRELSVWLCKRHVSEIY